jgi:hypothetical protein
MNPNRKLFVLLDITFLFLMILYLVNLLNYEGVGFLNAFHPSNPPVWFQISAVTPSLIICTIIMIRFGQKIARDNNTIAFLMLHFTLFLTLALVSAIITSLVGGVGGLGIYWDRVLFSCFLISFYFLYEFTNEVFRGGFTKINNRERIFLIICTFVPIILTAFRQTTEIPDIIENVGLGLAAIVLLIPNILLIYHSFLLLRNIRIDDTISVDYQRSIKYIGISSLIIIIFTVLFAIIVLAELYKTWLYWTAMILIMIFMICFYNGYSAPKK